MGPAWRDWSLALRSRAHRRVRMSGCRAHTFPGARRMASGRAAGALRRARCEVPAPAGHKASQSHRGLLGRLDARDVPEPRRGALGAEEASAHLRPAGAAAGMATHSETNIERVDG